MNKKIKIGDQVAVLDDTLKGIVVSIHNHEITLKTTDDFLVKYNSSDLVLLREDQKELSKYIDISNEMLLKKQQQTVKKKHVYHKKKKYQTPMEVDLHIHQLIKSTKGMDTYAILNLQLDTAKRQLEFAIKKKIRRVVFIHGVGKGVLQTELNFLLQKYPVEFQAASFQKYGFGATEVFI